MLARLPEEKVRREIEHGVIDPEVVRVGRAPRRLFRKPEIYYLALLGTLGGDIELSRPLRRRLYQVLKRRSRREASSSLSPVLTLNYDRLIDATEPRIKLYEAGKRRIESSEGILGGEPVFRRTRLSVRHVGGMRLKGAPVEEILDDYPYLTEADVEFAALYAEANPPLGRPKSSADAA